MSYEKRKGAMRMSRQTDGRYIPMGDVVSSIVGDINTVTAVATDPYMPEVLCRIGQLKAVRANQPKPPCQDTPLGLQGGVGLGKLILPLRGFVYAEQYPILYPLAAFVVIGLPFLIGYQFGRSE